MIEPIGLPGLRANERGYATGDADWPLARARLTPVQDDPAIAAAVNGPVAPRQIVMQISVSLVDADGQVLAIGGRLLVQEATRHSWAFGGPQALDAEAWLAGCIAGEIGRLLGAAADLAAANDLGLLAPATTPAAGNSMVVAPETAAAMAAMLAGNG